MEKAKTEGLALLSKYRSALMGFAALWILMTHEWQVISPAESSFHEIEYFIKRIGFCGVDIFFLLSGIGMVYALEKSSLPRFYFNRLKRILIPFITVAIVMAVVDQWEFRHFLRCISGVAFYMENIYSILWFVPAIVTFYLLVPLYFAVFRRSRNQVLFTTGAIALWLLLSMVFRNTMREDLYGFTNRIPIFLIGVLFGWFSKHTKPVFGRGSSLCFGCILVLGIYLAWQTNMLNMEILVPVSNCCVPNILIAVSLPFLLAKGLEVLSKWRGSRWLGVGLSAFLGFFGMMSLEFYCVQEWIASKTLEQLVQQFGKAGANAMLLLIVTVCGLLLYFFNKGVVWCIDRIDEALVRKGNGQIR